MDASAMNAEKTAVALLLILIIGLTPLISAKGVQKLVPRDEFLYVYFSHVLNDFEYSLRYALENNSYGLTLANTTLSRLALIREEAVYYRSHGVNARVMNILPPFYRFSQDLVTLDELIKEYYTKKDPAVAAEITQTVGDMENALGEIRSMRLFNGTEVLRFDTAKVESYLRRIADTVRPKRPKIKGLTLRVTDDKPILNETVTFFGATPENGTVTLVITRENSSVIYLLNASKGFFSTSHTFDELGNYTTYAIQGNTTSGRIRITVQKIPTTIIVTGRTSALINTILTLRGELVDYYGRPLPNRTVLVNGTPVVTDASGAFSRNYTSRTPATIRVPLKFGGDETHTGTATQVILTFSRMPTAITLRGPENLTVGREGKFSGVITPPLNATLTVYVNGTPFMNVKAVNGSFSFTIRPRKSGKLRLYATFPGDTLHGKATSNVLLVTVLPKESNMARYALVLLVMAAIGVVFIAGKRRIRPAPQGSPTGRPPRSPHEGKRPVEGTEPSVPEDVGEAYTMLRRLLKDRLRVPESLTPRETLRTLRDWEGLEDLRRATMVHERYVYGGASLSERELTEFREAVKGLMGVLT